MNVVGWRRSGAVGELIGGSRKARTNVQGRRAAPAEYLRSKAKPPEIRARLGTHPLRHVPSNEKRARKNVYAAPSIHTFSDSSLHSDHGGQLQINSTIYRGPAPDGMHFEPMRQG